LSDFGDAGLGIFAADSVVCSFPIMRGKPINPHTLALHNVGDAIWLKINFLPDEQTE